MNIKTALLVLLFSPFVACNPTMADLTFSFSPSSMTFVEGAPGTFVDVLLSSNSSDALDGYSTNFSLSGGAGLAFTDPQAESHLSNTGYVFYNRSNSFINSLSSTIVNSGASMNISDISDNGLGGPSPFTVGGVGSESLLARLDLSALTAGNYTLSLLSTSSFNDVAFNNFAFNTPSLNISVLAAVPEPSSIGGPVALALGGLLTRRKRNKKRRVDTTLPNGPKTPIAGTVH